MSMYSQHATLSDVVAEYECLRARYASAVRRLQDIAAMGKKAGSESAKHRLIQLGEPIEPESP